MGFNWKTADETVVFIIHIRTNKQPFLQVEEPLSVSWLSADLQTPSFV